jgi:hypothetical protein
MKPRSRCVPVPKHSRVQKAASLEANDGEPKGDRRGRRRSALEEDGSVTCETLAGLVNIPVSTEAR